ncbi:MAG: large subunit ribosomal protein L35 [Saprospiraceae bacterium]|jgi:large subunit ribosomal protein L35
MPKMKTNSSAKKRFKVTGSGKIKRNRAYARHLMRKKSKKAKLNLSHSAIVKKCDEGSIKHLLCMK